MIGSPLRYPGGKSKAVSEIVKFFPSTISEFREPLVGGGSLFIYVKQNFPEINIKINDINRDIYCFWENVKNNNEELVYEIKEIKKRNKNGKKLFNELKNQLNNDNLSDFERAVNFFILNRISFSGLTTSGGYSKDAFRNRFTISSIDKILDLKNILKDVEISQVDYSNLLNGSKKNVLIYLDPPYLKNKNSKLYGKNGDLHINFNHDLFYERIISCKHNLIISYDNSIKNLNRFSNNNNFFINSVNIQYGMNNIARGRIPRKSELIITNYSINKNATKNLIKNQIKFNISSKKEIFLSIIKEIDQSVNHWKKISTLQNNIFNKNDFKETISEKYFKIYFESFINFLKDKKYLDLSIKKGCGKIMFKLYKWNIEDINDYVLNSQSFIYNII